MSIADRLMERGMERGMEQGRENAKLEFALSVFQQGDMEPEKVAKIFGLSLEELLQLKKKQVGTKS